MLVYLEAIQRKPTRIRQREKLARHPWLPECLSSLRRDFEMIPAPNLNVRARRKRQGEILAKLRTFQTQLLGAQQAVGSRAKIGMRGRQQKIIPFFAQLFVEIESVNDISQAALFRWSEYGIPHYKKIFEEYKRLRNAGLSRGDYDQLTQLRKLLADLKKMFN